MTQDPQTRSVWRVRRWVRLLSVGVPVLFLVPVLWPAIVNPSWTSGLPADQCPAVAMLYAVFALSVWCAF